MVEMADLLAHHVQLVSALHYIGLMGRQVIFCFDLEMAHPLAHPVQLASSPFPVKSAAAKLAGCLALRLAAVASLHVDLSDLVLNGGQPAVVLLQVLENLDKHTSGDVQSPGQAYEEKQVQGGRPLRGQPALSGRASALGLARLCDARPATCFPSALLCRLSWQRSSSSGQAPAELAAAALTGRLLAYLGAACSAPAVSN